MLDEHEQNKLSPVAIIQEVPSVAMAEALLLSKSSGIPPPLPRALPPEQTQTQQKQEQRKSDSRYTTLQSLGFSKESKILEDRYSSKKLEDLARTER